MVLFNRVVLGALLTVDVNSVKMHLVERMVSILLLLSYMLSASLFLSYLVLFLMLTTRSTTFLFLGTQLYLLTKKQFFLL